MYIESVFNNQTVNLLNIQRIIVKNILHNISGKY